MFLSISCTVLNSVIPLTPEVKNYANLYHKPTFLHCQSTTHLNLNYHGHDKIMPLSWRLATHCQKIIHETLTSQVLYCYLKSRERHSKNSLACKPCCFWEYPMHVIINRPRTDKRKSYMVRAGLQWSRMVVAIMATKKSYIHDSIHIQNWDPSGK